MDSFVPSRALEAEIKEFCARSHLTPRESDILGILVEGTVRIKDVAAKLGLSPNTINNHVNSIFTKTRTTSKSQLLAGFLNSVTEELERARFMRQTPQVLMLARDPMRFEPVVTNLRKNGFFVCAETSPEDLMLHAGADLWRFVLVDLESVPSATAEFVSELQSRAGVATSILLLGKKGDVKDRIHAMHIGAMDLLDLPVDEEQLVLSLMCRYIENDRDRERYLGSQSHAVRALDEGLRIVVDQIGAGGVAVASQELDRVAKTMVKPGEFIRIKLRVCMDEASPEESDQTFSAHGQVVWRGEGSLAKTGVRFVHLAQAERAFVARCTQERGVKSFIPCDDLAF